MLHIPALRFGQAYESLESIEILHHRTRQPVARVSQIGAGVIARDFRKMAAARDALSKLTCEELIDICSRAADLYLTAALPIGNETQSPDQYVESLSATTGMPQVLCRNNMQKIAGVLKNMRAVLNGLTRGLELNLLDDDFIRNTPNSKLQTPNSISYRLESDCLGAVLPSNSPGVHGLWLPAIPLKIPLVIKPGREEPWTPFRIAQAFMAAGAPPDAFCYYPTDHAGSAEILRLAGRSMLFGDAATTQPYANDPRVQLHGPGFSKILIGDDRVQNWRDYIPLIVSSIAENGGRSCLNASAVWTPSHGREIADAVAAELAKIEALPAEDDRARLAGFAKPEAADYFAKTIEQGLQTPGAEDFTARHRSGDRLVRIDACSYVLPTLVFCQSPEHPLANREFLLPYASVVECPQSEMLAKIGPTLVCTAITDDAKFTRALMSSRDIDRLNIGPVLTWRINWEQPHEGNLFEHLYRRRAFQRAD